MLGVKGDGAARNGMWATTLPPWRPELVGAHRRVAYVSGQNLHAVPIMVWCCVQRSLP